MFDVPYFSMYFMEQGAQGKKSCRDNHTPPPHSIVSYTRKNMVLNILLGGSALNARESGRQLEKRKTKFEMNWLNKRRPWLVFV